MLHSVPRAVPVLRKGRASRAPVLPGVRRLPAGGLGGAEAVFESGAEGVLLVKACLPYERGFRRTLHRLKFEEERALAKPIGQMMGEAARSFGLAFQAVVLDAHVR